MSMLTDLNKKSEFNSILSLETAIKIAIYLVVFIVGYVKMQSKLEEHGTVLTSIQADSKESKKEREEDRKARDLQIEVMKAELNQLDVRTSMIEQQLKDNSK